MILAVGYIYFMCAKIFDNLGSVLKMANNQNYNSGQKSI